MSLPTPAILWFCKASPSAGDSPGRAAGSRVLQEGFAGAGFPSRGQCFPPCVPCCGVEWLKPKGCTRLGTAGGVCVGRGPSLGQSDGIGSSCEGRVPSRRVLCRAGRVIAWALPLPRGILKKRWGRKGQGEGARWLGSAVPAEGRREPSWQRQPRKTSTKLEV